MQLRKQHKGDLKTDIDFEEMLKSVAKFNREHCLESMRVWWDSDEEEGGPCLGRSRSAPALLGSDHAMITPLSPSSPRKAAMVLSRRRCSRMAASKLRATRRARSRDCSHRTLRLRRAACSLASARRT